MIYTTPQKKDNTVLARHWQMQETCQFPPLLRKGQKCLFFS